MNRKFHHSISALVASAAFMVLGLVAAVPGPAPSSLSPSRGLADSQALDGFNTVIATPAGPRAGKSARRQRHRLVMPYFSFSSRS